MAHAGMLDCIPMGLPEKLIEEVLHRPASEREELVELLRQSFRENKAAQPLAETIQGQVSGYWFAPHLEIPAEQPSYDPTGALLPRPGERLAHGARVLDLVRIERTWYPLSESGRYTYAHSLDLLHGERYRFIPAGGEWGSEVYEIEYGESLEPKDIPGLYGPEAGRRARPDRRTVQLELTRLT